MPFQPREVPGGGSGPRPPDLRLPANWAQYLMLAMIFLLVIVAVRSSAYTVSTQEQAVVLRLGRLSEITEPGFHFKLPFGIDEVHLIPKDDVHKEEFGFRTVRPGVRSEFDKQPYLQESLTLTGDLNIADVEWVVQYKIKDSRNYLFSIEEPAQTVRDISEAVVRQVVGSRTVDQVLTSGRNAIELEARKDLQEILDGYKSGIQVIAVQLRSVTPPEAVQASFNDVNRAEQDREKLIDQARAAYNRAVPSAEGEASRTIAQAEGNRVERVNRAKGDADRFTRVLTEYRRAPEVMRRRLYLEAMGQLLPTIGDLTIIDSDNRNGVLPLLDLGRTPGLKPAPEAP